MPCQTAIFDLDGTLLDTLEDLFRAVNQALSAHTLPTRTRDEVKSFVGNGVEMLIRRAVPAGSDEALTLSVLADFKAKGLSELAVPKTICVVEEMPLMGTGKVDYVKLKEMAMNK